MSNSVPPQPPKPGSKWHRPNSRGRGFVISTPAETRHVVDRTLGGGVVYVSGRLSRRSYNQITCTLAQWHDWAANAKEVQNVRHE